MLSIMGAVFVSVAVCELVKYYLLERPAKEPVEKDYPEAVD
jgi:hypothetical protein